MTLRLRKQLMLLSHFQTEVTRKVRARVDPCSQFLYVNNLSFFKAKAFLLHE